MEYLGLLLEIAFLAMGVYLYLFAIGKVTVKDASKREKAEQFRSKNSSWLRLAALALTAIMLVNVFLHVQQLLSQ